MGERSAIDLALVLEQTGEDDAAAVRELIMRRCGVDRFAESCAKQLSALTLLSLSHNAFTRPEHFQYFGATLQVRERGGALRWTVRAQRGERINTRPLTAARTVSPPRAAPGPEYQLQQSDNDRAARAALPHADSALPLVEHAGGRGD